jgi:subtilisin family serine protease
MLPKEEGAMCNRWKTALVLGLALLVGILTGCVEEETPTPPPPTETPEQATPTPLPISDEELKQIRQECADLSEKGRAQQADIPKGLEYPPYQDLLYVAGQVILTGPSEGIKEIIAALDLPLEWSDSLELDDGTVIALYQIADGRTVEQVVCEVNRVGDRYTVSADPNYHVSPAGGWTGGGSPWTQNGDWAQEQIFGGGIGTATSADFQAQWAFGQNGIGLFDSAGNRLTNYTGDGVRIGIFDTSPFAELGSNGMATISWQTLQGADGPPLTVQHIEPILAPTCPGIDRKTGTDREGQNLSNHGLFVAGLAHAVAPASEIYLVRVLEDDACGSLHTIEKGLSMFIIETIREKGTLRGTVINLSLGVHEPPEPRRLGLPEKVESLARLLKMAESQGAVVVAAAGNDSYADSRNAPHGMEVPAAYPFVLGVAASDAQRERGCFSNQGDVAAPGGDGQSGTEMACEIPDCQTNHDLCLISLVRTDSSAYGFAYWLGTSFATPLVSGQAALLLDGTRVTSSSTANEIIDGIKDTTCSSPDLTLPNGIINLASCP